MSATTAPVHIYPLLGSDLVVLLPMSLGLVTALIIVADGWAKSGGTGIDKSAKLKSLLYVFGGSGFLSILTALDGIKDFQTEIILSYLFFTTIFLVILLVAFAAAHVPYFISSFRRDHQELKFFQALAYSGPLVVNLLFEGFEAVTRRLREEKLAILIQPDVDLNEYNTFLEDMYYLDHSKATMTPDQRVSAFTAAVNKMFAVSFRSSRDEQYNASLYCLPPSGEQYVQVCGLDSRGHGPLSATNSLCSTAAKYPSIVVSVGLKNGEPVLHLPETLGKDAIKFQCTSYAKNISAIAAKSIYAANPPDKSVFVLAVDVFMGSYDGALDTRLASIAWLIRWGLLLAELDPELIGLAAKTLCDTALAEAPSEMPESAAADATP